ncbi:SLU7 [Candida oxycetoniae]|uniref:Pre-mRNA-splicing factor SLU7 n=1 Tax=Candida oxycetoniae TaxID=497107 RepID=A0AAI9STZ6_9ASCO|nr:SLU7 [Candida oxycetoniae]KAI3402831.2 SLU7 [Candida oxycetoniae]
MPKANKSKSNNSKPNELNPYIPKYIISKPWYQGKSGSADEDYLSHQRKTGEIIDHSLPQTGQGIKDDFDGSVRKETQDENYDAKRDRWYGFSTEEWLEQVKRQRQKEREGEGEEGIRDRNDDSDDTDYELELQELELERAQVIKNIKEDPMEKMLRDRQDVPVYIQNITSRRDGKIRIDYDPKSRLAKDLTKGFFNDRKQFVKKLEGKAQELKNLQSFAWETKQGEEENLGFEANPTLVMMKAKQTAEQNAIAKRKKIIDMYQSSP